ncbi:hypothetical protein N8E89_18495 (plasmid) [Phyllobacterium sp. A18/5-2]|uniref:hypothetical protein n=1 Tax=Phyllobacterium sp. A18/5-2 TaxID=2978392 RepID=UPI0021C7A76A|nr:hypothetical protein [Phyllobacterium sp. A18/5-2]UXN66628.1 hypothetical protein N8E89_18495 [Phyllobacterium sp. A18/5-2]
MTKRHASGIPMAETLPVPVGPPRDKRFDGYLKGAGLMLAINCAVLPFAMYYDILDARPNPPTSGTEVRDPLNRTNQKSGAGDAQQTSGCPNESRRES